MVLKSLLTNMNSIWRVFLLVTVFSPVKRFRMAKTRSGNDASPSVEQLRRIDAVVQRNRERLSTFSAKMWFWDVWLRMFDVVFWCLCFFVVFPDLLSVFLILFGSSDLWKEMLSGSRWYTEDTRGFSESKYQWNPMNMWRMIYPKPSRTPENKAMIYRLIWMSGKRWTNQSLDFGCMLRHDSQPRNRGDLSSYVNPRILCIVMSSWMANPLKKWLLLIKSNIILMDRFCR